VSYTHREIMMKYKNFTKKCNFHLSPASAVGIGAILSCILHFEVVKDIGFPYELDGKILKLEFDFGTGVFMKAN
jgi:hypothetical protein